MSSKDKKGGSDIEIEKKGAEPEKESSVADTPESLTTGEIPAEGVHGAPEGGAGEDAPKPGGGRFDIRINDRSRKGSSDESAGTEGSRIVVSGGKRRSRVMDIRAARKRQKEKRRLKTLLIVLILLLLGEVAYIFRASWVPGLEKLLFSNKEIVVNDGKNQKGNFPITYSKGSVTEISYIGNFLVAVDKNQVKLYTESGDEAESFSHSFADPVLKTAEKRMMLYDKGGTYIKVMNRKNEIFNKTLGSKIILADIADNNNFAVVTSNEKYPGIMTVYDPNGREIFKWSSSSRILSISFAEDGDSILVTTFAQNGGQLCSTLRHFDLDSDKPRVKSGALPVLAIDCGMSESGDYWVVGDDRFLRLDENGDTIMEYEYTDDLVGYCLDKSCAALCFKRLQRQSSRLVIIRSDSAETEPDVDITSDDGEPMSMVFGDGKLVLLKTSQVDCYNIYGTLMATAGLESRHSDMTFFGNNIYFLDFREINKISFDTK